MKRPAHIEFHILQDKRINSHRRTISKPLYRNISPVKVFRSLMYRKLWPRFLLLGYGTDISDISEPIIFRLIALFAVIVHNYAIRNRNKTSKIFILFFCIFAPHVKVYLSPRAHTRGMPWIEII